MSFLVLRRYVSYSDQYRPVTDGDGKAIIIDPTSYAETLGSVAHNLTVTDVDFPGGSFDLDDVPLSDTSDYPNTPPIAGVKSPWTYGYGSVNYYTKTALIFNSPHTYTWNVNVNWLRLNIDVTNGAIYWRGQVVGRKSTYPNGSSVASVSFWVKRVCGAGDFSVAGDYVLDGSVTHAPTGQTIWGSSASWGVSITA
jgi:hypothetical protein